MSAPAIKSPVEVFDKLGSWVVDTTYIGSNFRAEGLGILGYYARFVRGAGAADPVMTSLLAFENPLDTVANYDAMHIQENHTPAPIRPLGAGWTVATGTQYRFNYASGLNIVQNGVGLLAPGPLNVQITMTAGDFDAATRVTVWVVYAEGSP